MWIMRIPKTLSVINNNKLLTVLHAFFILFLFYLFIFVLSRIEEMTDSA